MIFNTSPTPPVDQETENGPPEIKLQPAFPPLLQENVLEAIQKFNIDPELPYFAQSASPDAKVLFCCEANFGFSFACLKKWPKLAKCSVATCFETEDDLVKFPNQKKQDVAKVTETRTGVNVLDLSAFHGQQFSSILVTFLHNPSFGPSDSQSSKDFHRSLMNDAIPNMFQYLKENGT